MGYFSRIVSEQKSMNSLDLFREIYGGRTSNTGKTINVNNAIDVSAVYACVRVIAEGIAQVPLKLMQEGKDGRTRNPAKQHPLYNLLATKPNHWQTSFEFRENVAWHVVLTGDAFVFKNQVFGKIKELIPFEPGSVTVLRSDDLELSYRVTAQNGSTRIFPAEAIWHIRGPSWDGWNGLDAVRHAREAIGLALATEEQHAKMHKNGVRSSGVYSIEGTLSPQQYKDLKNWIDTEMAGLDQAGKPMVMDRAAKWLNTSMTGVDAQHLETRRFQIEEICRFLRVLPIMAGYSDKASTYASAEQMFLAHMVHTLGPWYTRLEQSMDGNLLTQKERDEGYYVQFVEEGLLRTSVKETAEVLDQYVNGGLMTPNEGRAKMDLPPDKDPKSDQLRVPANIVGKQPAPPRNGNDNQNT